MPKRTKHYKNWWHSAVVDVLRNYTELKNGNSVQAILYTNAVERSLEETAYLPDGELRLKAIRMRYFEKPNQKVDIVAYEISTDPATVSRWCSSFVRLVGKKAGF